MRNGHHSPGCNQPFQITRIRQVTEDLAVAELDIGPVHISSVWIGGLAAGSPFVSWPRSAKGFPIISVTSEKLRQSIEGRIIERVAGWERA